MSDPRERYFDNAATTPLDPRVLEAMLPWLSEDFGNANSIHSPGLHAYAAVERAREKVAAAIGAEDPSEIVFTSGATEANNWVLAAFPGGWVSPVEHSSIWEQIGPRGLSSGHEIPETGFVSMMAVNNETGGVYGRPRAEKVHVDATQAIGKLPFSVEGADFVSFSAHKFHGPKGVGALFARGAEFPAPLLFGGEQESGYRAGTLNVPAIVGMGEAIEIAHSVCEGSMTRAMALEDAVREELEPLSDWHRNGNGMDPLRDATGGFSPGNLPSPFIVSLSFLGIEGETLVVEMDRRGYAISSGAACSSRSTEPSHVLTALGYPSEWLRGTIRISFGRFNGVDETVEMARTLRECVRSLRRLGG